MLTLIKKYLLLSHLCKNKQNINKYLETLKEKNLNVKIPETFEEFKNEYKSFYSDHPENDETNNKIYNIFKKYYNEDYYNVIKDFKIKSIKNIFQNLKLIKV